MSCQIHNENPPGSRLGPRGAQLFFFVGAIILLFCVARDAAAAGSPAFVQSVAASGAGTVLTLSFPQPTLAGDIILVGFDFPASVSVSSVYDAQGNNFAEVGTQLNSPGGVASRVYYAGNVTGGTETVTVRLAATSPYIELYLTEYSGVSQTNPIDAQAGASGTGSTVSSGYAPTDFAGDMIYAFCVGDGVCKAGSGFIARSNFYSNLIEDEVAGAAGSYAATGSASTGWTMQMVALQPASSTMTPPVITSATTARGTAGAAFSYQITATNGPTSYAATGLPSGLTVNGGTGLISGTPTAAGTSTVTLTATNSAGAGKATLTVTTVLPVSFVQAAANQASGTANALSFSFPQNTLPGDLILVAVDFAANASVSSISDSQSDVFTEVGSPLTSPGGVQSRVYYAKNINGGADAVTVKLTANSSYIEIYLTEYAGMNQTNPIDAQAGASGSSGTVSSGNATTTAAGDLIYGYCVGDGKCSVGSGFTARSTFDNNLLEVATAGAAGSYSATASANNGWTMQMVALKSAASGVMSGASGSSPLASLSSTILSFSGEPIGVASAAQVVTLTNTGSASLTISSIALTGTNAGSFTEVNTCILALLPGGQCTIAILFIPLAPGAATASLAVADNASGSPQTVSLSGAGSHSVTLSWTASSTPGVMGYDVYRGTTSGGEGSTPLNSTPINGTSYTDSNVAAGVTYYYMVTAVASNGVTQSSASPQSVANIPSP